MRPDGKPFVRDKRGAVPRIVIEEREGIAFVVAQFSGDSEEIGPRPFSLEAARQATVRLLSRPAS